MTYMIKLAYTVTSTDSTDQLQNGNAELIGQSSVNKHFDESTKHMDIWHNS